LVVHGHVGIFDGHGHVGNFLILDTKFFVVVGYGKILMGH